MLITAPDLAAALDSAKPPTVLDVRWQLGRGPCHNDYLAGHVPGAAFVDLDAELADPPGRGGRHPLPDPQRFGSAMRAHGVRADRGVVVYDAVGGTSAARAWWLLRFHGHGDVRLLDGGYPAWAAAGLPQATGEESPGPGDFLPAVPGVLPVVDADGAAAIARDGVLIDSRTGERYRGETEPVDPVAGHVPGAVNLPTFDNVDDSGAFLPVDVLRQRFASVGAEPGRTVGAYCGSGVNATHQLFALALAGIDATLYAGSWSDWITDPSRPVATGG